MWFYREDVKLMETSNYEELGQNLLENYCLTTSGTSQDGLKETVDSDSDLFYNLNDFRNLLINQKIPFSFLSPEEAKLPKSKVNVLNSLTDQILSNINSIDIKTNFLFNSQFTHSDAFQLLSLALFLSRESMKKKSIKYKNKYNDLQKHYDEVLKQQTMLEQHNDSASHYVASLINNEEEINEENNLLRLMSSKFDEVSNEVHQLTLKSSDQESEIAKLKQEKMDLELEIEHISNNQPNINAKNKAQENDNTSSMNAKIFVLENDINALQMRIKELNSSSEKKKSKILLMTKIVGEKDDKIQKVSKEIENLKIKYDQLSMENEEKETTILNLREEIEKENRNNFKIEENENLKIALNQVSNELEKVNDDLINEYEGKSKLFDVAQKQTKLLILQENKIKELYQQIENEKQSLNQISHNDDKEPNFESQRKDINKEKDEERRYLNDEEFIEDIKEFIINNNFASSKEIDTNYEIIQHELLNEIAMNENNFSLSVTVINLMKILFNFIDNSKKHKKEKNQQTQNLILNNDSKDKQRILNYVSNILRFLDEIANSGEIQSWLIDENIQNDEKNEDFRDDLIQQCKRIESFLVKNGFNESVSSLDDNFAADDDVEDSIVMFSQRNNKNEDNDFLVVTNKLIESIDNPSIPELLFLIKYTISSNDFLRKFSEELKEQNERLLSDLRAMRYEINEVQKSEEDKFLDEKNQIISELQKSQKVNKSFNKLIKYLRLSYNKITANNKNKKKGVHTEQFNRVLENFIQNCFHIIRITNFQSKNHQKFIENNTSPTKNSSDNGHEYEYDDSDSDNVDDNKNDDDINNKYIFRLEKKVKILNEKNSKLLLKIKFLKEQYNKQKAKLSEEFDNSQKFKEDLSNSLIEKEVNLSDLNGNLEKKKETINDLKKKIADLTKQFLIEKSNYLEGIQKKVDESETKIKNLEKTFEEKEQNMKENFDQLLKENNEKMRTNKLQLKSEIRRIQAQNEMINQRSEEMRQHYEKLIEDLKKTVKEIREREKNGKNEKIKLDQELSDCKSQLSKIRIDNKMLVLKLQTNEEKVIRDKNLTETQNKMKVLKIQNEKESEINGIKEKYEFQLTNFFGDVFNAIKNININFIDDFSRALSKDYILDLLNNKVNKSFAILLKEKNEISDILKEICKLLKIKTKNEEKNIVKILKSRLSSNPQISYNKETDANVNMNINNLTNVNNLTNYDNENKLNHSPNSPKNWETWARRLHSLITDSFNTVKTAKELQTVIEEELMSAIGQRKLFRKIEILRSEKKLLLKGISFNSVFHQFYKPQSRLISNSNLTNNIKVIQQNGIISANKDDNNDNSKYINDIDNNNNNDINKINNINNNIINDSKLLNNYTSIIQLISIVVATRRMQRLSGHLKCFLGISNISSSSLNESGKKSIFDTNKLTDININKGEDVLPNEQRDSKKYPILSIVD